MLIVRSSETTYANSAARALLSATLWRALFLDRLVEKTTQTPWLSARSRYQRAIYGIQQTGQGGNTPFGKASSGPRPVVRARAAGRVRACRDTTRAVRPCASDRTPFYRRMCRIDQLSAQSGVIERQRAMDGPGAKAAVRGLSGAGRTPNRSSLNGGTTPGASCGRRAWPATLCAVGAAGSPVRARCGGVERGATLPCPFHATPFSEICNVGSRYAHLLPHSDAMAADAVAAALVDNPLTAALRTAGSRRRTRR